MWIDEKIFYKVFKEHPDWFTSWVDEGNKIWNRQTGEIVYEDGTVMNDLVYRPPRDYNNYWKDCFEDEPKSYSGHSDLSITLSYDDYIKDPEKFLSKSKDIDNTAVPYRVTISSEDDEEDCGIRRVNPDLMTGVLYRVQPSDKNSLYKDITSLSVEAYSPTINFDDNYTDEWYCVWASSGDGSSRKMYDNHTFEDCKNFIYDHFYVIEKCL